MADEPAPEAAKPDDLEAEAREHGIFTSADHIAMIKADNERVQAEKDAASKPVDPAPVHVANPDRDDV